MKKDDILENYRNRENEIRSRLRSFNQLRDVSEERKFEELVFVILSSQTEAEKAWKACEYLNSNNILLKGNKQQIGKILEDFDVSYPASKADHILSNREKLSQPTLENPKKELKITQKINEEDLESTREWFVENIEGISWKGASHFLRNIGYGNGFAIISSHISSLMYELDLAETANPPQNRKEYLEKEEILKDFSDDIGMDNKVLDLVLWSMKTDEVFK